MNEQSFLNTYNELMGMPNASIITTIFGAFCFTFVAIICWGKLVEEFKAAGGFIAGAMIVGTFWVLNHKLPGFGVDPQLSRQACDVYCSNGDCKEIGAQFGLIFQNAGPWIDMGWSVACGLFVFSSLNAKKPLKAAFKALPRMSSVIAGGIVGGVMVGLIGFSGSRMGFEPQVSKNAPKVEQKKMIAEDSKKAASKAVADEKDNAETDRD